jgi:hypothetical protein
MNEIGGEVRRGVVGEADLVWLINEENVGYAVPSPHARLGAVRSI